MTGRVRSLKGVEPAPSVTTVGFFDGVHLGHQDIVATAVVAAAERNLRAVAVTFDRHPAEVLRPGSQPPYLMTRERRVATLLAQGVDLVVVLEFDLDRSRQSPDGFVEEVLVEGVGAREVVVGDNFRFGHKAAGDVEVLTALGETHGFAVRARGLRRMEARPVSSTQIRRSLEEGDVAWARGALGRPHVLDGTVVRGAGRGRTIGVPTANLEVDPRLLVPARGVYAGHVEIDPDPGTAGTLLPAVMNVGVRPTFGAEQPVVEAHVLDGEPDLYGRHLAVWFAHRLRDERRFPGPDALVAQIHRDIARARDLLTG